MQTDPARIRRTDPGDPEKCPVWQLHQVYSNDEVKQWVQTGCKSAGIGCIDCKKPLIESIQEESLHFKERAKPYLEDHNLVRNILADGAEKAIETTEDTLEIVKEAMGIKY
jgi:tryptophanyl-tRNA synthetase